MSHTIAKTIAVNATLRIQIKYDQDVESPASWDNFGEIAYCSHREVLGTEDVSRERLDEISKGIRDGSLIGMAVFAYIHSGATIATTPFSCQWDSGQSGFVYCTKEKAIKEFGKKIMTAAVMEKARRCLQGEVKTFDQYLTGDIYGFVLERVILDEDGDEESTEELDACWGYYGMDSAIEEAQLSAEQMVALDAKEALEKAHWAARDVVTEAA